MTVAHKGQILPLKKQLIPITKNTVFHANYDNDLNGYKQEKIINPLGFEKSLLFNGVDGHARADHSTRLTGFNTITIEARFKTSTASTRMTIVGKHYLDYEVAILGTQFWVWYGDGVNYSTAMRDTGVTMVDNKWHHIAIMIDKSTGKVNYMLDGVSYAEFVSAEGPRIGSYNSHLAIGCRATGVQFFNGNISDVRIWNYLRNRNEIIEGMNMDYGNTTPGLVGYWKLNEGEGRVTYDSSSNSNDVLLTGGITWSEGRIIATIHPTIGRYGGAVAVEDATTNGIIYPYTGEEPSITTWARDTATVTITQRSNDVPALFGDYVTRWTKAADANNFGNAYINGTEKFLTLDSNTWTFSCYVRRSDGAPVTTVGHVYIYFSTDGGVRDNKIHDQIIDCGNGWYRVIRTRTFETAGKLTLVGFSILDGSVDWYFDGWQVEPRAFATSYTPGTRSAGRLSYPVSLINPSEGTINLWAYIDPTGPHSMTTNWAMVFSIHRQNGSAEENQISLRKSSNSTTFRFYLSNDIGTMTTLTLTSPSKGWHMFTLTWSSTLARAYLDGVSFMSVLNPNIPLNFDRTSVDQLRIGSWSLSSYPFNSLIDEFRIDKVAVPEDEVMSWYQADAPFYNYLDYTNGGD